MPRETTGQVNFETFVRGLFSRDRQRSRKLLAGLTVGTASLLLLGSCFACANPPDATPAALPISGGITTPAATMEIPPTGFAVTSVATAQAMGTDIAATATAEAAPSATPTTVPTKEAPLNLTDRIEVAGQVPLTIYIDRSQPGNNATFNDIAGLSLEPQELECVWEGTKFMWGNKFTPQERTDRLAAAVNVAIYEGWKADAPETRGKVTPEAYWKMVKEGNAGVTFKLGGFTEKDLRTPIEFTFDPRKDNVEIALVGKKGKAAGYTTLIKTQGGVKIEDMIMDYSDLEKAKKSGEYYYNVNNNILSTLSFFGIPEAQQNMVDYTYAGYANPTIKTLLFPDFFIKELNVKGATPIVWAIPKK
jgi:hypothetical protein